MFSKILIANRGEIAVRIIRTCRRMGIATVAAFSEADADSLGVEMADEAVAIGEAPAALSYLRGDAILAAAQRTGAEAIHPGFGFLAENADFARACEAAGLTFIGPNPRAIEAMGDKIASKRFAREAGVSIVPGHVGEVKGAAHAGRIAKEIGYPVMLKASAGGGGKGIRIVRGLGEIEEALVAVMAEAKGAFGDDRVFIEKYIERPRHIEIQVLGDKHGGLVHLFERECSIQRRNQKVIEEAPSPLLDAATREAMASQALALARAVDYDSAGTVEFVAGQDKSFYFMEMNTRLQVEHPVTELVCGVDLVEQMIRSAAGEPLNLKQGKLKIRGWAIESRIYAEDPYRRFLPSIGRLVRYAQPAEGEAGECVVRVDSGVREGDEISVFYDPMIAKLVVWGPDRDKAITGMGRALEGFLIDGPGHNTPFLSAVMDQERFASGALSTDYISEEFPEGFHGLAPTPFQRDVMTATALSMHRTLQARRNGHGSSRLEWAVIIGRERRTAILGGTKERLVIDLPGERRSAVLDAIDWRPGQALFSGRLDGVEFTAQVAPAAEGFSVRHRAAAARVLVLSPLSADLHERLPIKPPADTSRLVLSPMPGLVVSMDVAPGDEVKAGQSICVVEAMKMQNIIRAERDGAIKAVGARAGETVAADAVLAEFA
ncbi:MAG TPA: acetyl/propionyl/methylcrotonyl-CoA carboxylase subunit alpha [Caulobacteraceae bacterium]|nr:acetyl/propionyl/methylcrotonyl-CoA carboxylase subunit alpha [Caulobacteraceae bacterium]